MSRRPIRVARVPGVEGARGGLVGRLAPAATIVLACFALYANALPNDFVFDDVDLIRDNDALNSFSSIPKIFSENLWGLLGKTSNYYRPLVPLLYLLLHRAFGPTPWVFHLANILLHAGTSLVAWLVIDRLVRGSVRPESAGAPAAPGFLAAAVFAVHPVHTEAVTWISGMMDVGCTFFSLLSFLLLLRADESRRFTGLHAASLAAFLLGALCKEPALVLPLLVAAHAFIHEPRAGSRGAFFFRRWLPYLGVASVYLALRAYALRGLAPFPSTAPVPLGEVLLTLPFLFARYLAMLVLPVGLTVLHHIAPVADLLSWRALTGLAVTIGFASATLVAAARRRPSFLALCFTALPLLPALYVPALTQRLENALADRYLYFSSFGGVLILALALARARSGRAWGPLVVATGAAIAVFSVMTVERNTVWSTNLTLWTDAEAKAPRSAIAHANLGYALLHAGRTDEGRRHLREALALDPEIPGNLVRAGVLYSGRGFLKKAILELNLALLFDPRSVEARYNLGVAYQEKGWTDAAIEQYRIALSIRPDLADARLNLGIAYGTNGLADLAVEQLEEAVRLMPDDPTARLDLAKAYRMKGWIEMAREQEREAASRASGVSSPKSR